MNPNYRVFLPCLAIVLALSLLVSPAPPAHADAVVGDGTAASCIDTALDTALTDAGPGGTVTFNCGPVFVSILTANTKTITVDTTIDGGGLIALDGQGTHGVLAVRSGATLNLKGLQVKNGRALHEGGGVFVVTTGAGLTGALNVSDSRFTGNVAEDGAAIMSRGPLNVSDTMFDQNTAFFRGGAIFAQNSAGGPIIVTITRNSFIDNNSAQHGGGIYFNSGSSVVTNNTFSGNTALQGGAIFTLSTSATLTNNTLSGNSATQGANIWSTSNTLTFLNNIIANPAGGGSNCFGITSSVDLGGNLDSGNSCGFNGPGSLSNTDPRLAPLDFNGGPTQTFALCTGGGTPDPSCTGPSPAIDAGNNTGCPATDQRGVERPQNGTCDIGAYELKQNDPPQCGLAVASPATLWPGNHKLSPVSILGVSDPNNDQVTLTVTAITQDEPASAGGDAAIQNGQLLLRADRDGKGNGRVYRVSFSAADGHGGTCTGQVRVCVPHDQGKLSCTDDGQRYSSLQP